MTAEPLDRALETRVEQDRIALVPESRTYDAKSHAALENSKSFAADEKGSDGRYEGPRSKGPVRDDEGFEPGVRGPFRGYAAGYRR